MKNWFPVPEALVKSDEFKALTVAERVHFLWLISEFNLRGGFYRSDLEVAVTLGLSEDKVRRSRRKLQRLGWVQTRPGFQKRKYNVATSYTGVRWAEAGEDGTSYAQVHRYAFEVMLAQIRENRFTHADVLLYVGLCYLRHRYDRDRKGDFFVAKRELRELSGLPDAPGRVKALYDGFQFTNGGRLFEYSDKYHKLKFTRWSTFADPSEEEVNRKIAEGLREDIRKRVTAAKKEGGRAGQVKEDPVGYFQRVTRVQPGPHQVAAIRRLVEKHGRETFELAVRRWGRQTGERAPRRFLLWCERGGLA